MLSTAMLSQKQTLRMGWVGRTILVVLFTLSFETFTSVPQPAQAATTCRTEAFNLRNDPSKGTFTLHNCSDASTAAINTILSNTDAAYLTYHDPAKAALKSTDVYLANNQWVAWIDQTTTPGVLRGLWPIDSSGNPDPISPQWIEPKYTEPGATGLRSLVQIVKGFDQANPPAGYGGLHVEIWREPGRGAYTYPNVAASSPSIQVTSTDVTVGYVTKLVAVGTSNNCTYTDPTNNTSSQLKLYMTYYITPSTFQVLTALGSTNPTHVRGDAGELLLLVNRACPPFNNCQTTYGYTAQKIRENSFYKVQVNSSVGITESNGCIQVSGTVYDFLPSACETFGSTEDRRMASVAYSDYNPVWTLMTYPPSPAWSAAPTWIGGINASYGRMIAYHYNDGGLGLTGMGSLDVVVRPPSFNAGGSLYVDDTTDGSLRWNVTLTHN